MLILTLTPAEVWGPPRPGEVSKLTKYQLHILTLTLTLTLDLRKWLPQHTKRKVEKQLSYPGEDPKI